MSPIEKEEGRFTSLDVFRGLTIAGMILVNTPGDWAHVYPPLRHAAWHGWTAADLVFPFFLFILGAAVSFSFAGRMERGEPRGKMIVAIARRTLILLALGLFLNGFPDFALHSWRIPGVLQRVALCFFFSAVIFLYSGTRSRLAVTVALLAGYWLILRIFSPSPSLEPSGTVCWLVDSWLFKGHTYVHAPAPGFDPEGLLSTLPAIGSALAGTLAGDYLRSGQGKTGRFTGLFGAAVMLTVLGLALDAWLPINKNLWTSSYVVLTTGLALFVLLLCWWLVDVKGYERWAIPLVALGRNSIAAYVLSSFAVEAAAGITIAGGDGGRTTIKELIHRALFASWLGPYDASLAFALAYLVLWTGVLWILYRKRVFVTV